MPPPLPPLPELLGSEPPPSVQSLPPAAQEQLALLLAEAGAEQRRALKAALDATLSFLPPPLRVVVRKIVLG